MIFGLGSSRVTPLIAVDFGSSSIKAIAISGRSKHIKVEAFAELETPKGAIVDHQISDVQRLSEVIAVLAEQFPSKYKNSITAVAGSHVITKIIHMDAGLSDDDLETQIEVEAENLIPFPMDEISLDFEVLGPSADAEGQNNVLLSAARSDEIERRVDCLAESGIETTIVDVEAHALARAWGQQLPEDDDKVYAAVDIGAHTMSFSAIQKGETIYFRHQNIGGEHYTQAIANYYGLPVEQAEEVKVTGQLPDNYDLDVLQPFVNNLLQNLRRNIQLFSSSSGMSKVDEVVLSGGCTLISGLVEQIESELQIPTKLAEPFAHCSVASGIKKSELIIQGPKYMIALGLALRSFGHV